MDSRIVEIQRLHDLAKRELMEGNSEKELANLCNCRCNELAKETDIHIKQGADHLLRSQQYIDKAQSLTDQLQAEDILGKDWSPN